MPPRLLRDILVIDNSALARSMYPLLFTPDLRFRVRFGEEYQTLMKRSVRLRPDLLVINSNALPVGAEMKFPSPTILISSRDRIDLKEAIMGRSDVMLIEKPLYPYDLISVANRLMARPRRGRKPRRRLVGE